MDKVDYKGTVLIIDDTISIIDMVKTALTNSNYKILIATSGTKGIVSAEKGAPDLILLDIMMPEIDGYETIKRLKANPATENIPVMFMSALSETFDKVKAFGLGAVDYVTKPLNLEELLARVGTQVSLYKMQEKLIDTNKWLETEVDKRINELKKSQEKYQTVADFTHDWEYWLLPDGSVEYMSPSCQAITGYSVQEFAQRPALINDIIYKDDFDIWDAHFDNDECSSGTDDEISFRIKAKSGELKWIGHVCKKVYNAEGVFNGTRVSNRDISALKNSEVLLQHKNHELQAAEEELRASNDALKEYVEKLSDSETLLRESQEMSHVGSWNFDVLESGLIWSDETFRIFGFEPGSIKPTYELFLSCIHPDDREMADNTYTTSTQQGIDYYELEHRIIRNNTKEVAYVVERCNHLRNKDGMVERSLGMVSDITKRKHAELSVERYNTSLQKIIDASAMSSGTDFFKDMAKVLEETTNSTYSFIGELISDTQVQTIALSKNGEVLDNFIYDIEYTPCENVISKTTCCYPQGVTEMFPKDQLLIDMGIEAYVGTPIFNHEDKCIGIIVSLYDEAIDDSEFIKSIFEVFSGKIGGEIERAKSEKALLEKNRELQAAEFELKTANDGLKEMINQVQENEERYRNLQENMQSGVVVYKPVNGGTDFEIVGFNSAAQQISGISRAKAIGKTICSLIPGFEQSATYKSMQEVLLTGTVLRVSAQKVYDESVEKYTDNQYYKLPNGELVAIFDDVTDKILAEKKLIESEHRFRALAENIPGVIYLCLNDDKYSMVYMNDKVEKLTGYSKEDFILGKISFVDLFEPDYEPVIREQVDAALQKKESFNLTYKIKTKEGKWKWIEEYGIGIYNDGDLQFIEGTMMDIDEKKSMELIEDSKFRISDFAASHSSKEILTKILDEAELLTNSNIGFYHFFDDTSQTLSLQAWSTNTIANMCNAAEENMEYSIDKAGVWVDSIREKKSVIHNSYEDLKHKKGLPDGHAPVLRELVVPVIVNDKVVAILGVGNKEELYTDSDVDILERLADMAFDIVLRKKAEEGLIENEHQLQLIFNNSPALMLLVDSELRLLKANKAALDLVGKSYSEMLYSKGGDAFNCVNSFNEDGGCGGAGKCQFCGIRSTITKTINTGKAITKNEADFAFTRDGKVIKKHVYVSSTIATKNPDTFLVIIDDVTEQKKAEQAIIEERNRSKNFIKGTNAGTWEWNVQTGEVVLNERWAEIIGYSLNELGGTIETWVNNVHPDDVELANELLLKHFNGESEYYDVEFRQIHKEGHFVWVQARGKVIERTKGGKPVIMSGTHIDITKRKDAEDRYKMLSESSFEGIALTHEGEKLDINKQLADIYGYTVEEFKELELGSFIHPDDMDMVLEKRKSTDAVTYMHRGIRKDGSVIHLEVRANYTVVNNEKMKISVVRDITEQKLAQQKILQAIINTEENERKRVAQELHDGLGPVLSTVKLYTESYLKTDNDEFKAKIEDQLLLSIDEALQQVSSISNNLSPHVLDDFGLNAALERFIDRLSKLSDSTKYELTYSLEKQPEKEVETTLYRVATELINNSLKYAKAKLITINLQSCNKSVCLTYTDDGVGFDFNAVKDSKKGMGLFNIVNRVKTLNGELKFIDDVEQGVKYEIRIPYNY